MTSKEYLVKCPNCGIDYPLRVEADEDMDLKEGDYVSSDRTTTCLCKARIDEWGMVTRKNGIIKIRAGIKGFIIPAKYNFINKEYE